MGDYNDIPRPMSHAPREVDGENTYCRMVLRETPTSTECCGQPVSVVGAEFCEACGGPSEIRSSPMTHAADRALAHLTERNITNTHCLAKIQREGEEPFACGRPVAIVGALYCPACRGPQGPREEQRVTSRAAVPPTIARPPVGRRPSDEEIRSTIADAVKCLVWCLVGRDYRQSADWMEDLSARCLEESEHDRRAAKRLPAQAEKLAERDRNP